MGGGGLLFRLLLRADVDLARAGDGVSTLALEACAYSLACSVSRPTKRNQMSSTAGRQGARPGQMARQSGNQATTGLLTSSALELTDWTVASAAQTHDEFGSDTSRFDA